MGRVIKMLSSNRLTVCLGLMRRESNRRAISDLSLKRRGSLIIQRKQKMCFYHKWGFHHIWMERATWNNQGICWLCSTSFIIVFFLNLNHQYLYHNQKPNINLIVIHYNPLFSSSLGSHPPHILSLCGSGPVAFPLMFLRYQCFPYTCLNRDSPPVEWHFPHRPHSPLTQLTTMDSRRVRPKVMSAFSWCKFRQRCVEMKDVYFFCNYSGQNN